MKIHVHRAGRTIGPVSLADALSAIQLGKMKPDDLVSLDGSDWRRAAEIPELARGFPVDPGARVPESTPAIEPSVGWGPPPTRRVAPQAGNEVTGARHAAPASFTALADDDEVPPTVVFPERLNARRESESAVSDGSLLPSSPAIERTAVLDRPARLSAVVDASTPTPRGVASAQQRPTAQGSSIVLLGLGAVLGAGAVIALLAVVIFVLWVREPDSEADRAPTIAAVPSDAGPLDAGNPYRAADGCTYRASGAGAEVRTGPGHQQPLALSVPLGGVVHPAETVAIAGSWIAVDRPAEGWVLVTALSRECPNSAAPWPPEHSSASDYPIESHCDRTAIVGTWLNLDRTTGFRFDDGGTMVLQNPNGLFPGQYRWMESGALRWAVGRMVYNQVAGRSGATNGAVFPDCDTLVFYNLRDSPPVGRSVWFRYTGPPGPRRAVGGADDLLR